MSANTDQNGGSGILVSVKNGQIHLGEVAIGFFSEGSVTFEKHKCHAQYIHRQ
jgi:hypothetical protein